MQKNGSALQWADAALKRDRDIVLAAIQEDNNSLQYANVALRKDRDVVLAAVTRNGYALQYVDVALRQDRDVVLAAVRQNYAAFTYSHSDLHTDVEIVAAVISGGDTIQAYALMNNIFATCTNCMGCWSILHEYLNPEQMDRVKQSANWSNFMDRLKKEEILARVLHIRLSSIHLRMHVMSFLISAPTAYRILKNAYKS